MCRSRNAFAYKDHSCETVVANNCFTSHSHVGFSVTISGANGNVDTVYRLMSMLMRIANERRFLLVA